MEVGEERTLILTGWGTAEYIVSAAAALEALNGRAKVIGVSKRRLPEMLTELSTQGEPLPWKRIYILGVALGGHPEQLVQALERLKAQQVETCWISAYEPVPEVAERVTGVFEIHVLPGSLLEAVGRIFEVDIGRYEPLLAAPERASAEARAYQTLIAAAQFQYRNYQDLTLYETTARLLSKGVRSCAWAPEVRAAIEHYRRYGERELIGKSPVIETLRERIHRVAEHDHARVLILGESGTGKETIAQLIHTHSPRNKMPLISFNCASVATNLLEDRFFGHEKGAFTNAVERTDGLFQLADGGTLFLDEIGEMPLDVQALLLRVLEGGRFMRVGGREELRCNVRLITATNRNLPQRVREGHFRADLYYRLNVVPLRAPPLREHLEDIPLIANAWWRKFHDGAVLTAAQVAALQAYDYPGNVRELFNLLDRATALQEEDFARLLSEHRALNAELLAPEPAEATDTPDALNEVARRHIRRIYEKYHQNIAHTAKALGIARNTVKKYL